MISDEGEFTEFVSTVWPELVGALTLRAGSRPIGEELAQEALSRLWQHRSSVRNPRAWLYRCAFNLANSAWRRRRLARQSSARPHDPTPSSCTDLAGSRAERLDMASRVYELPARQREVIIRYYYLDQSITQIANEMGRAEGTVKAHLATGRERLARAIRDESEGAPNVRV